MTIDKTSPMLRQLHIDQFARPLMFVRILSLFVVVFWVKAFAGVIVDALTGTFIDAVYQLPLMLAPGFPAWVFWRSIDVTSAVTDPLMRVAYLVLGVICLIVVLIAGLVLMASYIADTDDMSDTNSGLVFGPFIQFFSWGGYDFACSDKS